MHSTRSPAMMLVAVGALVCAVVAALVLIGNGLGDVAIAAAIVVMLIVSYLARRRSRARAVYQVPRGQSGHRDGP